jgi:hypothetical protein
MIQATCTCPLQAHHIPITPTYLQRGEESAVSMLCKWTISITVNLGKLCDSVGLDSGVWDVRFWRRRLWLLDCGAVLSDGNLPTFRLYLLYQSCYCEGGGDTFLRTVYNFLPDCTAAHPIGLCASWSELSSGSAIVFAYALCLQYPTFRTVLHLTALVSYRTTVYCH